MHSQRIRYVLWESEHKIMHFGKARTRMTLAKWAAVLNAFVTSTFQAVPSSVWKSLGVLTFFLIVDYLATQRANSVCHESDQRSEQEKFATKLMQYSIVLSCCIGAMVIASNVYFIRVGLIGCGGVEFVEMLRQLGRLERCGGVKMPYVRKLLQLPAKLFYDEPPERKGE